MKTIPEAEERLPGRYGNARQVRAVLAAFALLLAPMVVLAMGAGAEAQAPSTATYAVEDLGTLGASGSGR